MSLFFHLFAADFHPLLRFPLNFVLSHIFPFGRVSTPACHFVYITLFRHFVYDILFKSLRLLRLHLMQASALPSLPAFITFGYYPDNGSMRTADNRGLCLAYLYVLPLLSDKICTFLHIFYVFLGFHLQKSKYFCTFVASFPNRTDKLHKRRLLTLVLVSRNPENFKPRNKIVQ